MKLKVCGMKYNENIQSIAGLEPNFLGFIFYDKSPRYFTGKIPEISDKIKKVGVFVDESINTVISKVNEHDLVIIQLHGNETALYCSTLKEKLNQVEIIKVFSIDTKFDFNKLQSYEAFVDYYLFDTKGKFPGGNGFIFDWTVLNTYPSKKPYFLSGGIGLEEVDNLNVFFKSEASNYCYAIDINSRFEIEPGLKNIEKIKEFKSQL